jgi:hypothetical protein
VRAALIHFARWLRTNYEFPIRVPVYLLPGVFVNTLHGVQCSASFFAPFHRNDEPYIRVATGDYPRLKRTDGRNDAPNLRMASRNQNTKRPSAMM